MNFLEDWVLKPDTLPAWLQALAAFIALGLSYWAVRATGAEQRNRDLLEQRGIGVAIYPELLMLPTLVGNVRQNLPRLALVDGDQSFALHLERAAIIQIPPMIDRNIDKLFLLGNAAGPACLSLVRFITQYNDLVHRLAASSFMMDVSQKKQSFEQIEQHLALLEKIIEKCAHDVRPIHDAVKE
jgi:hypothetical protein